MFSGIYKIFWIYTNNAALSKTKILRSLEASKTFCARKRSQSISKSFLPVIVVCMQRTDVLMAHLFHSEQGSPPTHPPFPIQYSGCRNTENCLHRCLFSALASPLLPTTGLHNWKLNRHPARACPQLSGLLINT